MTKKINILNNAGRAARISRARSVIDPSIRIYFKLDVGTRQLLLDPRATI